MNMNARAQKHAITTAAAAAAIFSYHCNAFLISSIVEYTRYTAEKCAVLTGAVKMFVQQNSTVTPFKIELDTKVLEHWASSIALKVNQVPRT